MWLREGAVDMCVYPGVEVTFFIQSTLTLAVGLGASVTIGLCIPGRPGMEATAG